MTPSNIAGMAALKGLDVIALMDHNSCRNCPALLRAAAHFGLVALPGMARKLKTKPARPASARRNLWTTLWKVSGA